MPVIPLPHYTRLTAWLGLIAIAVLGFGVSAEFILSTDPAELAAPCPALSAGDRFKVRGFSAVYILDDNLRRLYFPHSDVYFTWFKDYAGIKEIITACVDNYPIPDKPPYGVNFRSGTQLVKLRISNSVYAILPGNKLAKISNEDVANQLYGSDWNKLVKDVNDEFWTNFTAQADPIVIAKPHDGMVVKINETFYLVENNQLHQITGNISSLPAGRSINAPENILPTTGVALSLVDIMADPSQTRSPITPAPTAPTGESQSAADTTAPIISNIRVGNITQTSATISWTTNELASSSLSYSDKPNDTSAMTISDQSVETAHTLKIPNLFAGVTYYFYITATDKNQNTFRSAEQDFQTSPPPSIVSDAKAGQKKWNFKTAVAGEWLLSRSAAALNPSGDTIYTNSRHRLYAISYTGTLVWSYNVNDAGAPTVSADGTIYIGSSDNKLIALKPDGDEKWSYQAGPITGSPALAMDGTVYFGDRFGFFYAINPDGQEKWRLKIGDFVDSSPIVAADGTIYFGSRDGKLYAARPDGTVKWTFKTGDEVYSSPAIGADRTIYFGSYDGKIYAVNPDGTEKWRQAVLEGSVINSPVVGGDGTVYIAGGIARRTNLYALNGATGAVKWSSATDADGTPAIGSDGTIFVPLSTGSLWALNSAGQTIWKFDIPDTADVTQPAVGYDGTVYFGYGSYLYAVASKSAGLANSPWPKFQKNNQNTGR